MALIQSFDLRDMSDAVDVPIPDSTTSVKMRRLHTWENGTSVMIVNFPTGWSRPIEGSYACAEEFLVFEGEIEMSGDVISAGVHTWVPPHSLRLGARTPHGAVALAWFYGKTDWNRRVGDEGIISQVCTQIAGTTHGEIRRNGSDSIAGSTIKPALGAFTSEKEYEVIDIGKREWSLFAPGHVFTCGEKEIVRLST